MSVTGVSAVIGDTTDICADDWDNICKIVTRVHFQLIPQRKPFSRIDLLCIFCEQCDSCDSKALIYRCSYERTTIPAFLLLNTTGLLVYK